MVFDTVEGPNGVYAVITSILTDWSTANVLFRDLESYTKSQMGDPWRAFYSNQNNVKISKDLIDFKLNLLSLLPNNHSQVAAVIFPQTCTSVKTDLFSSLEWIFDLFFFPILNDTYHVWFRFTDVLEHKARKNSQKVLKEKKKNHHLHPAEFLVGFS